MRMPGEQLIFDKLVIVFRYVQKIFTSVQVSEGARVLPKDTQMKSACILTRETGSRLFSHSLIYCSPLAKSKSFQYLMKSGKYSG